MSFPNPQFMPAGGCAGQSLVSQAAGSTIGDMTSYGGRAAAFDSNTNQGATSGCGKAGSNTSGYVGKDWGSGTTRKINGVKTWGSNNAGYSTGTVDITLSLYGSNSAPSGPTDGVKIKDLETFSDGATTQAKDYTGDSFDTSTGYRYHWLTITRATGTDEIYLAEVEFYECT